MQEQEIYNKLNEIFRVVFDNEEIVVKNDTTSNDIEGWDSLSHISLISAVETGFNVSFSTKEVLNMKNVGDMVALIKQK